MNPCDLNALGRACPPEEEKAGGLKMSWSLARSAKGAAVPHRKNTAGSATQVMPLDKASRPPRMAESYQSLTSIFALFSNMDVTHVV